MLDLRHFKLIIQTLKIEIPLFSVKNDVSPLSYLFSHFKENFLIFMNICSVRNALYPETQEGRGECVSGVYNYGKR